MNLKKYGCLFKEEKDSEVNNNNNKNAKENMNMRSTKKSP